MSSTKRGSNYSQEEITFLLATVRKHLPIGQEEWKIIAHEHSVQFPLADRCFTSLRKKFNTFANARMPTGQPHCPPHIIEAKRILEAIKHEADIETFNIAVIAQVPAENNEAEVAEGPEQDVPVEAIDVPEEDSNPSASSSTASSAPASSAPAPAPVISPRLQRISTPRKKNSPEDMSVQDFFKFSMMQGEEDRKDRIERERVRERERQEDREKRDGEERIFRNMFMAVLMQGNNGKVPEGKAGNEEK